MCVLTSKTNVHRNSRGDIGGGRPKLYFELNRRVLVVEKRFNGGRGYVKGERNKERCVVGKRLTGK